jgi:carboxyl-terminal processing protease
MAAVVFGGLLALLPDPAIGGQDDWRRAGLAAFDETWQTINDTFYDPDFGGLDWAAIRTELRLRAERAETPDGIRRAINDMLGRLGKSHFVLLTSSVVGQPLPGDAVVPIEIRVMDDGVVVTRADRPEINGAIRPGDVLVTIDGADPLASASGRDERARRLDGWRRASRALHGRAGSSAQLTLRDLSGAERTVTVTRVRKTGEAVTLGNLPELHVRAESAEKRSPGGRRVGLIAFNAWMPALAQPIATAVDAYRRADGIVMDLRGNAGGLADMMRGIAGHFLAEPALLGRLRMRAAVLEFRANPRRSTADGRRVEPYAGPLAILVDEQTASASECFAGAMQSLGRARVFGARTMGQALPASTRVLSNGDALMYAVGDFTTSTGRRLEGDGVSPDEEVGLSRAAIAEGRDEPLRRALAWIDRHRAHEAVGVR